MISSVERDRKRVTRPSRAPRFTKIGNRISDFGRSRIQEAYSLGLP